MELLLLFIAGLVTGAVGVWFFLNKESTAKTIELARLETALQSLQEQKVSLEKAEEVFRTTFSALSGEALKSNNQAFLELAQKSLEVTLQGAKGEISEKTGEIKNVVAPLGEILKRYEDQIQALEKNRSQDYGSLKNEIQTLMTAHQLLQKETGNLVSALKTPHLRGKWGEAALKRIVEMTGMSEHCSYAEQVSSENEESRIKPDMVLYLPGDRQLVVDSKFPDTTISDYMEAKDDAGRKTALLKHSQSMRRHVNELSSKKYWDQFPQAPECVVMFVPLESSISAAFSQDPALMQEALGNKVIIAGPVSFYALLLSQASGWRQAQVTQNTQIIADLGKQLYERLTTFLQNLSKTRDSLEQSVKNFNKSIGSLESRVLPSIRKFKELGISDEELPAIEPIEHTPRQIEIFTEKVEEPDLLSNK